MEAELCGADSSNLTFLVGFVPKRNLLELERRHLNNLEAVRELIILL
jgi:hypothetical protein